MLLIFLCLRVERSAAFVRSIDEVQIEMVSGRPLRHFAIVFVSFHCLQAAREVVKNIPPIFCTIHCFRHQEVGLYLYLPKLTIGTKCIIFFGILYAINTQDRLMVAIHRIVSRLVPCSNAQSMSFFLCSRPFASAPSFIDSPTTNLQGFTSALERSVVSVWRAELARLVPLAKQHIADALKCVERVY